MSRLISSDFDSLSVGSSVSRTHTVTSQDLELFALSTGDVNPLHLSAEFAATTRYGTRIAHGFWTASQISMLLGTALPGPGTIYLSQSLEFLRPVMLGETLTTTLTVKEKIAEKHIVVLECLVVNRAQKPVLRGEARVIAPDSSGSIPFPALPIYQRLDSNPHAHLEFVERCKGLPPLSVAVVHPVDALSLGSALEAQQSGLISPILVGPEDKIRAAAQALGASLSGISIVSTPHSHAAADTAVSLAREGSVSALMKGKIHTDELMHSVLDKAQGLRTGRQMSHIAVVAVPNYPKPLFFTDAAINIRPTLSAKRDITQNAIDLFRAVYGSVPRVAIISAVETVNEAIPSTLDATALCKMAERGQISGGIVDGPLAFDNAISKASAAAKDLMSPVAGEADILVLPDLESANILYKHLSFLTGVDAAGLVLGARVPIILTSRASDLRARLVSCALASLWHSRTS